MVNEQASRGGRGKARTLAAGAFVLLALVAWLLVLVLFNNSPGDVGDPTAEDTSGPSAPTGTPFPSTSVGADGSPLPSRAPGQTDPTGLAETRAPMAPVRGGLEEPVDLGGGVTARVARIESVQGKARVPGEVSGPSLRITIEVTNDSSEPLRTVASGLVAFYGPDARPAIELSAPGVLALRTEIAPGESSRGRYVFRVPVGSRDQVRLDFSYSASVPKVIFAGGL